MGADAMCEGWPLRWRKYHCRFLMRRHFKNRRQPYDVHRARIRRRASGCARALRHFHLLRVRGFAMHDFRAYRELLVTKEGFTHQAFADYELTPPFSHLGFLRRRASSPWAIDAFAPSSMPDAQSAASDFRALARPRGARLFDRSCF